MGDLTPRDYGPAPRGAARDRFCRRRFRVVSITGSLPNILSMVLVTSPKKKAPALLAGAFFFGTCASRDTRPAPAGETSLRDPTPAPNGAGGRKARQSLMNAARYWPALFQCTSEHLLAEATVAFRDSGPPWSLLEHIHRDPGSAPRGKDADRPPPGAPPW